MDNINIYTDGGARGNPGPAATGVVVKEPGGKILASFGRKLGETTNNTAEYSAVLDALGWVITNKKALNNLKKINFFLDSLLVVQQLNGMYKVKNPSIRDLFLKVRILENEVNTEIFYNLIPREKNREADCMVNKTLDGY